MTQDFDSIESSYIEHTSSEKKMRIVQVAFNINSTKSVVYSQTSNIERAIKRFRDLLERDEVQFI